MPNSRCSRLNSARVSWRSLASRLVRGSSSSSSCGRRISARPIAIRCCSPPEAVVGLRSSVWRDAQQLGDLVDPPRDLGRGDPGLAQRVGEVLAHGQVRVEREGLEDHRHAAALHRRVGDVAAGEARPGPPPAARARRSRASVVVLPAAWARAGRRTRPRATSKRQPVERRDAAVALDQPVEPEVGHACLSVPDLGAQHLQALAHEGGEARPALGRDQLAVDAGAGRLDVDIDAAGEPHLGLAIVQRRHPLARDHAVDRDQDLHAVADGEDRLVGLVEVPDDPLHARVDADVFRARARRRQ